MNRVIALLIVTVTLIFFTACQTTKESNLIREPKVGLWNFWLVLERERPFNDILMFYALDETIAVFSYADSARREPKAADFAYYFPIRTEEEKEVLFSAYREIEASAPIQTYGEGYTYEESFVHPWNVSLGTYEGEDIEFRILTESSAQEFQNLFDVINEITKDRDIKLSVNEMLESIHVFRNPTQSEIDSIYKAIRSATKDEGLAQAIEGKLEEDLFRHPRPEPKNDANQTSEVNGEAKSSTN